MTSINDRDFRKILDTICTKVDLSGCKTPEEIIQRLQAKIKELHSESQSQNTDESDNAGVE